MRGNRRLIVTLVGQLLELLPILAGLGVEWYYVAAVAFITVTALIGYNVEDWLRASKSIEQVGQALIAVSKEIRDVATNPGTSEIR